MQGHGTGRSAPCKCHRRAQVAASPGNIRRQQCLQAVSSMQEGLCHSEKFPMEWISVTAGPGLSKRQSSCLGTAAPGCPAVRASSSTFTVTQTLPRRSRKHFHILHFCGGGFRAGDLEGRHTDPTRAEGSRESHTSLGRALQTLVRITPFKPASLRVTSSSTTGDRAAGGGRDGSLGTESVFLAIVLLQENSP